MTLGLICSRRPSATRDVLRSHWYKTTFEGHSLVFVTAGSLNSGKCSLGFMVSGGSLGIGLAYVLQLISVWVAWERSMFFWFQIYLVRTDWLTCVLEFTLAPNLIFMVLLWDLWNDVLGVRSWWSLQNIISWLNMKILDRWHHMAAIVPWSTRGLSWKLIWSIVDVGTGVATGIAPHVIKALSPIYSWHMHTFHSEIVSDG